MGQRERERDLEKHSHSSLFLHRQALQRLAGESFFLMVEGSRIDMAGHDNDASAGLIEAERYGTGERSKRPKQESCKERERERERESLSERERDAKREKLVRRGDDTHRETQARTNSSRPNRLSQTRSGRRCSTSTLRSLWCRNSRPKRPTPLVCLLRLSSLSSLISLSLSLSVDDFQSRSGPSPDLYFDALPFRHSTPSPCLPLLPSVVVTADHETGGLTLGIGNRDLSYPAVRISSPAPPLLTSSLTRCCSMPGTRSS